MQKKLEHNYSHHFVNLENQVKDELDLIVVRKSSFVARNPKQIGFKWETEILPFSILRLSIAGKRTVLSC